MALPEESSRNESFVQDKVADFFNFHVRYFGDDWRALGWHSRRTQYKRFAVLCEVGNLHQTRVLDVGCGLGDLYAYLRKEGITVDYLGCDLLPAMVNRARERFPEARFMVRDAFAGLGDERYDYILSSGAFNIDFGQNLTAVQAFLRHMVARCTHGVAINFLSIKDHNRDAIFFHYDPQAMQTYCQTFCDRVELREDYLPNDFTLYLYPPTKNEMLG
jgi:SAM-dependent methyltransferase